MVASAPGNTDAAIQTQALEDQSPPVRSDASSQDHRWIDPLGQRHLVDPNVVSWLHQAAQNLPEGWKLKVTSGKLTHPQNTYTGSGPSEVAMGKGIDIALVDPKGNVVPYGLRQDPASPAYQTIQKFANDYIQASGGKGRWGGYFGETDPQSFGQVLSGYPAGARAPASLYGGHPTQLAQTLAQSMTPGGAEGSAPPVQQQAMLSPDMMMHLLRMQAAGAGPTQQQAGPTIPQTEYKPVPLNLTQLPLGNPASAYTSGIHAILSRQSPNPW